ncbi:ClC voltage-gated chloride channel protein [Ceratobasidium sp. AG-Ba]|nr:ClC voltage-gated chloride channel protein [Ceratobasidium sp. AG-Ba]QRW08519.1 ClC voltage-gated chloride channel protein [Ceratobasidium sp. AG-Ba]
MDGIRLEDTPRSDDFRQLQDAEELEQIRRYEDFTTIDWIQDSILERNRRLRTSRDIQTSLRDAKGHINPLWMKAQMQKLVAAGQSWFVVSIAGLCIGINAALISIVTEWLSDLKMGYCVDGWWLNQQFCCWEIDGEEESACAAWRTWSAYAPGRYLIYVLLAMLFSLVSAHLVDSFAKYAAGSGISEIKCILAGFVMQGYLGLSTLVIKTLTLPLVIASGLAVGKEGPSVHVACCTGNVVARLFSRFSRSQGKMRDILTAASAAGVAVAFGSPIGGVMFSIEEMSHTFSIKTMWRSFFCALVATVTLSAMNPFRTGKLVLFQVTYDRDWHFFEIIFFIIIGIFGGLYGAFVIKFNLQVAAFRRKHLVGYGVTEAVVLATLTAIVSYFNRFLRIDMSESLGILFKECEGGGDYDNLCQSWAQWPMVNSLFLATVTRLMLVIISYGSKVPCGIFVPSMAIGATFGRMIGIIVKAMYTTYPTSSFFSTCRPDMPCITPGTYALLGAAAALSGVMRITVTVVVIMFELTGALTYILPTMIVILVTKAVGDFLGTNGIADEMIRFNGYPYLEREDHAFNIPVSRVMQKELYTMSITGMTLREVEEKLEHTDVQGFPIVSADSKRTLLGHIGRTELRYAIGKARRIREIHPSTLCSFEPPTSAFEADMDGDHTVSMTEIEAARELAGVEEDDHNVESTPLAAAADMLEFGPWVNQTPLSVAPQLPLEIVMDLFKRMGPRVILVEYRGSLAGLITVKDVLRFIVSSEHSHPTPGSVWNDPGALDGLLEEVWLWAGNLWRQTYSAVRRVFRRRPEEVAKMLNADIMLLVAGYLQQERKSISALAAVNQETYQTLLPLLYSEVAIEESETLRLFIQTIISRPPSACHEFVKKLWIGLTELDLYGRVGSNIDDLRTMLCTLKNLKDMTITPTTPLLGILYVNLKPPFLLESLVCACLPDEYFLAFLHNQSSITRLELGQQSKTHWGARATIGLVNHYNDLASKNAFLPQLNTITSDSTAVSALCPGRPISRVEISDLMETEGRVLADSIGRSTSDELWEDAVFVLLSHLKATPIVSTLHKLTIEFHAKVPEGNLPYLYALHLFPDWVDEFRNLEELAFHSNSDQTRIEQQSYLAYKLLEGIKPRINPTLKYITIEGRNMLGHTFYT